MMSIGGKSMTPVHEHDCDACTYITSYPLRHPRFGEYDDSDKWITHADIYRSCDPEPSFYKYIVRYGVMGEYVTTNTPSRYCLVPWVDGVDDFDNEPDWLLDYLDPRQEDAA